MMRTRKGKKVYPLTAAQRLHFYSQLYCPKKQLLNIGTSLAIQQELDFETLKTTIYQAYSRCESMRLRFAKDKDGAVYQYVADNEEREVEFTDFSRWRQEDVDKTLRQWSETPFARFDSPMNRVVMLALPEGFQGLYCLVDHMTMDAQSLILFFQDIVEVYCSMAYEGVAYPKPMSSYLEQLEKDLAYEAGSARQQKDREFFSSLIRESEPFFADFLGPARLLEQRKETKNPLLRAVNNYTGNVEANISTFHLEQEPSQQLTQFCQERGVSMVCLLLMGLRTFLQKENDVDDVSIVSTVARRATLTEKRCGGTRIHCFPFRTVISREKTFLQGLEEIRYGQNALFRHANHDPVEYFDTRVKQYGLQDGQTYDPLSLTYQPLGLRSKELDKLGDIRYRSAWYSNGVAAQALYLTVTHRSSDNGLDFHFEYQTGAVTPQRLEYLYYYVCRILFRGLEDPDQTIGEIIAAV